MNQKELVNTIANLTGLPKLSVMDVLTTAAGVIAETLAGDEEVYLKHLGKFKPVRRALRKMVLPNGLQRTVGGKRVGKFCPNIHFQSRVNGEI